MPDQKSLYLGSPWRVEGSQEDDVRMRSRIVGAVDNPDLKSLVFEIQIEAERIDPQGRAIEPLPYAFRPFLDALESARSRLAH